MQPGSLNLPAVCPVAVSFQHRRVRHPASGNPAV